MSIAAAVDGHLPLDHPKDVANGDDQSVTDRLKFLEKEWRQLTTLFHEYLADSNDKEAVDSKENDAALLPACEITHISAAEWRSMQMGSLPRATRSLLTVAPKGRNDSFKSPAVDAQCEAGETLTEVSLDSVKASKSSQESAYRLILSGRAELMETLGEVMSCQAVPGFYYMFWPFKPLVRYGQKLRERLSAEESECLKQQSHSGVEQPQRLADDVKQALNGACISTRQIESSKTPSQKTNVSNDVEITSGNQDVGNDVASFDSGELQAGEIPSFREETGKVKSQAETNTATTENSASPTIGKVDVIREPTEVKQEVLPGAQEEKRKKDHVRLRDELRCIVNFMDEDMKNVLFVQEGIGDGTRKTIAFDYLWLLYRPGDVIFSQKGNQKRAYVVLHVTGGLALNRGNQSTTAGEDRTVPELAYLNNKDRQEREAYLAKYSKTSPFVVDCFYIDFDGTNFGPLPQKFEIADYEGEVAISSLEAYPARFDDNPKQTEKALIKRGKRFAELAQGGHKYYSGRVIREPVILETEGEVHGEIIIDFALAIRKFRKMRYDWNIKFGTGVIANPTTADSRELDGYFNIAPGDSGKIKTTYFMEDAFYDRELMTDFTDKTSLLNERPHTEMLSSESLMLLPPRVYGFSLLERKWYAFDLSMVENIKESDQSFDHLVLPDDHKKIMQALVQHHTIGPAPATTLGKSVDKEFSMDIVRGKGRGLIILLHGVPGVGKTSTAECVAAQTKRPLFPITCGDIGTHPEVVEDRLTEYFEMAHKWGCVLLLDEADVFLAKREKGGDLQRNSIVSVFLRVLEYYSGILILTTNRIGEFDEAFSSRIHIKLFYPKLDKRSTLAIWKMNMARIADSDIDMVVKEDEIKKFAKKMWAESADKQTQRWNGRQIRNAFQTAIALAKWDKQQSGNSTNQKPCLSVRQFEVVAETSAHFDNYISTMHGFDEYIDPWDAIAGRDLVRRNETPRKPTSRAINAATARQSRFSGRKPQRWGEEEDGDETDSDDNEEKIERLQAELERRKKGQSPSSKKNRDGRSGRKGIVSASTDSNED